MATSTDAPASRAATPYGGGDRLPVAPRQRRPGLAILAVVLILGGALFSAALVVRSGAKVSVVVLRQDVQQGQRIAATDLAQQQVAPGALAVIQWTQRSQVVGKTAAVDLRAGTLLNTNLLGNDPLPRADTVNAPVSLKPGQVPPVAPGESVRVLWTPHEGQNLANAPTPPRDGIVVDRAVVIAVSGVRSDGLVLLILNIPQGRQTDFTRWASMQSLSVVKLHQGA
ncbi:MAG: SAF domain-containing protein [Pseudonocardiales bacterium]